MCDFGKDKLKVWSQKRKKIQEYRTENREKKNLFIDQEIFQEFDGSTSYFSFVGD